jgi:hypothetical protein
MTVSFKNVHRFKVIFLCCPHRTSCLFLWKQVALLLLSMWSNTIRWLHKGKRSILVQTQLTFFFYWLWLHVSDYIYPLSGLYTRANSRYNIIICQTYDMLQPDDIYKRLKTLKSIRKKLISNNTIISEADEGNSVVIIIRSTCNDWGFSMFFPQL